MMVIIILGCSSSGSQSNINGSDQNSYNLDELDSYGQWVNIDPYGNVWQPYVVNDWMPFENGNWVFANGSWTWISYEPFGWIVYHYGYWYDDPFYGWVWEPSDNFWSPARVLWLDYYDYVGWAPLPPLGVVYGNPWEKNENHHWHVVKRRDFTEENIHNYEIVAPVNSERVDKNLINKPPDKNEMEKYIGKPIPEINITHENLTLPPKQIKKMNLPPQEKKRVEQNSTQVKKEVLVPKEDYHKQHNEIKQTPKNENQKK